MRSELSLPDDRSVVAHTRGRTLLRPTAHPPAVKKSSISVKNTSEQDPIVWMVEINELVKSMNLTLQNWVSRVSRIPGGIFGKLGGFSKSSLHVAALTKI